MSIQFDIIVKRQIAYRALNDAASVSLFAVILFTSFELGHLRTDDGK